MIELPIDFHFSSQENAALQEALLTLKSSPYRAYEDFSREMDALIAANAIPGSFQAFCEDCRHRDAYEAPFVVLRNCPVDETLPELDFDEPVIDKRNRKTTYVAEGFLLLYAKLMRQEPIGYANVNDGDIFQDIHPKRDLARSQSQKALESIFFHKDLANHFVRPDWVNILGLRGSSANEVYTSFVRNKDLLEYLDEDTCRVLRRLEFHTPYDDLSNYKSKVRLGDAAPHPVLGGATATDFRFFENRTVGLTEEASAAVEAVVAALHRLKKRVLIQRGDFVGSANNDSLHSKEVGRVADEAALRNRWLMKTVNVRSLADHARHFVRQDSRIVAG